MQNFSKDFEPFEEYYKTQKPNASMNDMVQASATEYNLEGELLEVFYECEKDLMAEAALEAQVGPGFRDSCVKIDECQNQENEVLSDASFQKARAFSEGDIKTLGNGNVSIIHSPVERPLTVSSCSPKNEGKSSPDTGTRRRRGISKGKSSMLAGRLLPTVNRGSMEGSQRSKNPMTLRGNHR
ncbi:hypothetical protein F3Y22_tig00113719pilonHSYRG00147 [Hibiscus syriacus]|uniref:Uncharacterized protein n=1 Tax=Hibiscus syriacus TaxID=106335 RepID=A0A6A2X522_HIBSY|nr:hypothetical protein F3Y22_tig00113719pilonHSYRG00147 [Hibiscus syriacus]